MKLIEREREQNGASHRRRGVDLAHAKPAASAIPLTVSTIGATAGQLFFKPNSLIFR